MSIHNSDIDDIFTHLADLLEKLGIRSLGDLRKAVKEGRVSKLEGFSRKAGPLAEFPRQVKGVRDVVVAGCFRRRRRPWETSTSWQRPPGGLCFVK